MAARITVTSQAEWDGLCSSYADYTVIEIRAEQTTIVIGSVPNNSTVRARDNSTVRARGNSTVRARDNSTVRARDNSTVRAWDNSTVRAWDNSTVEAWGNSTVEAWGNSVIKVYSGLCTVSAHMQSVIICIGCVLKVHSDPTAVVVLRDIAKYDIDSFKALYNATGDYIELYKVVREDHMDHHTGSIKYAGIVECPDWDSDPLRECGGGLHLSPTSELALRFHSGPILKCRVHLDDIAVYPYNVDKVRCQRVEVLEVVKAES